MAHSAIMRSLAVVSLLFGLALLFAPNGLLALYKAQPLTSPGIYNSMLLGGYFIAFAVMNWMACKDPVREVRHIILGTFVAMAIGFAVSLFRLLTDQSVPRAAWLNVLIFLTFAILYGYLQFTQPAPRRSGFK